MRLSPEPTTPPQPHPTPKSHVIPPGPHSAIARKPRNINDLISKPETPSGELRAKLLSTCHGSTSRSPPRGLDTHTRTTGAAGVEGGGRARASTRTPSPARLEAVAGPAGPGHGAGGWRQGQGGPRDRPLRAAGSRVAISRAGRRPPAHTAARPIQAGHAAAGDLAGRATPEIWRDHSHNRQRPGRLLHNSPHGSSPRRPRRISYDVRPVASHARSYRLG